MTRPPAPAATSRRPVCPCARCVLPLPLVQILDILVQLPALAVLYLQGNPCVKKIQHYRKVVIARMPQLKYLDDRPVFDDERLRAEAWHAAFVVGGAEAGKEAERAEIQRQKEEKDAREERNFRGACGVVVGGGARDRGQGAGGGSPRCRLGASTEAPPDRPLCSAPPHAHPMPAFEEMIRSHRAEKAALALADGEAAVDAGGAGASAGGGGGAAAAAGGGAGAGAPAAAAHGSSESATSEPSTAAPGGAAASGRAPMDIAGAGDAADDDVPALEVVEGGEVVGAPVTAPVSVAPTPTVAAPATTTTVTPHGVVLGAVAPPPLPGVPLSTVPAAPVRVTSSDLDLLD